MTERQPNSRNEQFLMIGEKGDLIRQSIRSCGSTLRRIFEPSNFCLSLDQNKAQNALRGDLRPPRE